MTEIKFFNLTFRYIDDVLSINNFDNWIPLLFPVKLEIKEKNRTSSSVSLLDIYLKFDPNGQLSIRFYNKRVDINFTIINFPHLNSNKPTKIHLWTTLLTQRITPINVRHYNYSRMKYTGIKKMAS